MGRAFEYRRAAREKRWDKMSRVFPKLAKKITIAAKTRKGTVLLFGKNGSLFLQHGVLVFVECATDNTTRSCQCEKLFQ